MGGIVTCSGGFPQGGRTRVLRSRVAITWEPHEAHWRRFPLSRAMVGRPAAGGPRPGRLRSGRAAGAGARSPVSLGTAVFGGMLALTVLGVFFIPFLYYVIQSLVDRRKDEAG